VNEFNDFQRKAFKWCMKREWLQIDRSPFLDAFILVGYIVGTGFGVHSRFYTRLNKAKYANGKFTPTIDLLNSAS